jgi:hypothetical protein
MRIERIKLSTIILMFSFYVLAQGIGFGFLFYSFIEYQPSGGLIALLGIFGIAGVLFLIAGLIGIQLSVKQIISFGKIVF